MSDKKKYPASEAMLVGTHLLSLLGLVTERAIIAGSLRRGRPEVGDVEILYIPKFENRQADFFPTAPVNLADEKINSLLASNYLAKRPSVTGMFTWGPSNKLAIQTSTGIPVDLFATTPEKWWVSLVIRTGSKDTNLRLTMGAQKRGASLNAYGSGVTWSDGTSTPATSEEHVFEMCNVPYLEPSKR